MLAFLNGEDGADAVRDLLLQAEKKEITLYMSSIQLIEVYYDRIYIHGIEYADSLLEKLYISPITILHEISRDIIREAGRLKTSHSISFADSIACATASCLQIPLVTSDHDEMEPVERQESIKFLWFR